MIDIYVTNLGKYNEGQLIGEWVSLPTSNEELNNVLKRIGINKEYEEYFLTDWKCEFGRDIIGLGEYSNIWELNKRAEQIAEFSECEKMAFEAVCQACSDWKEAIEKIENGEYIIFENCTNEYDIGEYIANEYEYLSQIPENLQMYFDFESFGHDILLDGNFVFIENCCVQIL